MAIKRFENVNGLLVDWVGLKEVGLTVVYGKELVALEAENLALQERLAACNEAIGNALGLFHDVKGYLKEINKEFPQALKHLYPVFERPQLSDLRGTGKEE